MLQNILKDIEQDKLKPSLNPELKAVELCLNLMDR